MNSYSNEPLKAIDGHARTVRELLDTAKYAIDSYQREYAWQERQVREPIDDLTGKFLDHYEPGHARHEVERYGHYFLGSVVVSHKLGQRFVVDGQQRLTTLTLLLIYLNNLQADRPDQRDVRNLIYSERYGRRSFNIDVPDRAGIMQAPLEGETPKVNGESDSVRNLAARHADIVDHFPQEIADAALLFFIDWLLENVHLVVIDAYADEDAYTIFETMNDRGLSLSLPDMLKGYVLAKITHEDDQRAVNTTWKAQIQRLREIGDEGDVDFFKDWLRARHAQIIRPGKKGAENKDFERIGSDLLARSLHPLAYRNNPAFVGLIERTGLPFRAYDAFGPEEKQERQELYIRIAEWVWNPSRLDLDGEKPPVHEPIVGQDHDDDGGNGTEYAKRHVARLAFWTQLLDHAKTRGDLHTGISPSRYNWVGRCREGMWWNYTVVQDETRAGLYIDSPEPSQNKALYDALLSYKADIEKAFGGTLLWQRLDDKRACRISTSVPGGWLDETTWPQAIKQAVDGME
jgi:hypothetical protein